MHRKCKKIVALMMITSILSQNLPISIFAESIQNTTQKEVASSEESSQIKLDELLHNKTIFLGASFDSLQDILPNELEKYPNIEVVKDDQSKIQQIIFNKEVKDEFVVKVKSGEVDTNQAKEQKVLYEIKYKDGKTENVERTINVVDIKDRINFYKTYKDKDGKDQKYTVFTIGFDFKNNKLVVSNQNYSPIEKYPVDTVYSVVVLDKEKKEKAKIELKGDYKSLSESLSTLGDVTLNAGDSVEVKSYKAENTFEMIDTSKAFNIEDKNEQEKVFTLKDEGVNGSQLLTLPENQTEGSGSGGNSGQQASEAKLSENTITIKGIKFSDPSNADKYLEERFKIEFDTENKKINITNQDGKIFSNVNEKYLEIVLYDKKGNIKQQVVLNGRDRSTDKKLDVFKDLAYEDGDYLYIWHKESESKFNIAGTVNSINGKDVPSEEGNSNGTPETLQAGDTPTVPNGSEDKTKDFTEGVPKEFTQDRTQYRFRLDSLNGLQLVKNEKPVIASPEGVEIDRTQPVDLTTGLSISDDIDKTIESKNAIVKKDSYNVDVSGEHNAEISVKDSWGLSSDTVTRMLTVNNTNDIDGIVIEVESQSNNGQNAFKIGFDDVQKKFVFIDNEGVEINSSDATDNFILSVYSNTGALKKKFRFKGQNSLNAEAIEALSKYKYSSGDYVSVWSKTHEKLKITGNVTKEGDKIKEDSYADGINDADFMDNVRFHLSEGRFKAVYNDAPVINNTKDITIKRGQDPDFLKNINVTDDHDNNITNDKVKTNYKQGDNLVVQTKPIKYSVKDSWGREGTAEINLTVEPANNIEKNGIVFKVKNETMLKMEFDSLTDKFKYTYNEKIYREGNASDIAFKLTLYDNDWQPTKTLTINNGETITKAMIADLSNIPMNEGIKIGVYAADKNSVSIYGDMISSKSKYENGFENEESMKNTYFEIKDIGLKAIYNQEPVIKFEDNTEILVQENKFFKTGFDPMDGVTVEDDIGIDSEISHTGTVEQSKIGRYTITYTVTDILGRSTSVDRTVHVVPEYRKNTIVLEETENNPLLEIGFNKLGTNFEVKYKEQVQQDNPTVGKSLDEEIFKIGIYGLKNEEIKTIKVSENNLESLKELEKINLRSGYTISLWAKNHSNLKIKGNLEKDSKLTSVEYLEGISDVDFMDNVRFRINGPKLKAEYNEAPVISFTRNKLDFYIGERTDFLEGAIFNDDKGKPNRETAKVYFNERSLKEVERDDFTKPGDYKLIYEITDNWGRKARETRTVKAKPGIERHTISFGAARDVDSTETSTGKEEFTGLALTIDHESKQIKLVERSNEQFLFSGVDMYTIDVLDKDDGSSKINGSITIKSSDTGQDEKFNVLENKQIEYGDKIKLTSTQGFRLKISGEMYNTGNNYEDGVISGDKLKRTEFVITERGLEEVVTEPTYTDRGDKVYIEVYTNFDGSYMGKYVIDPTAKTIKFDSTGGVGTNMDFRYRKKTFFTMYYYKNNGTIDGGKKYQYKGETFNSTFKVMDHNFETDGQYIIINIPEESKEYMPKLKIIGAKQGQTKFDDDFSDGIDDIEYLNNTRFVFKEGKLVAEYNKAPEIKGADDKDILLNGNPFDLREGVTVEDDRDNSLQATPNPGTINVNEERENTVTYATTDSWNRKTTKERKIDVRPGIFFNTIDVYKDGDTEKPIFTVGFDNKTRKYKVDVHNEEPLATHLGTEDAFKMYIIGADKQVKSSIDINGNEFVDNSIFEELNEVPYAEGDYIRVWRAEPEKSAPETNESNPTRTETKQQLIETLKINGEIKNKKEDYSNGIEDLDHMNNVAFKVRNQGFESIYNEAPAISNLENMTFYKSDTLTEDDLTKNLTIKDDYDNLENSEIKVINLPDFNRVDAYKVSFEVTDKWGRSSLQTITVTIKSNILNNKIDIYSNSDSSQQKLYTIGFDDDGTMNITPEANSKSQTDDVFSMTIFDRFGEKLEKVTFGANNTISEEDLNKINNFKYYNNQYIQFKHTSKGGVRINGEVVNTSHGYQNGFAKEADFDDTRFKITEDGLSETKKTPSDKKIIKGLPPIIMVRGEIPDLLEGVTVEHPSETIETKKITISGEDKLKKSGEHILTYSVTDSWGQTFSDERTVVVRPANMLEHNIIKVKNINNGGDVLEIGFDSLENKLTATQATRSSSLDNKFKLTVYDETGEVANTVSIKSPTEVSKAIEDINNIQIEEGYMIGLERTNYEHGLEIEGKVTGDTLPKDENYEGVEKLEQILRLEINDEGLKSVYNEKPEFIGLNATDVEIGKPFDPLYGVKVMDTHDGQIDSSQVVIEEELDITELGEQTLTYTVEDSWGRKTTQERTVWVISGSEKNSFDFYSKQQPNEKIFSLKIDSKNKQIKVETKTGDIQPVSLKNRTGNESTPVLDSSRLEENIVEIQVHSKQRVIKKLVLKGSDGANSQKLQSFNGTEYIYGDMISITIHEPKNKSAIEPYARDIMKISGDMSKDERINEDYTNGVDDMEFLDNVRFKINESNIEAMYNSAPVLEITNTSLTKDKSNELSDYGLLDEVTIKDDHDDIPIENVVIRRKDTGATKSQDNIVNDSEDLPDIQTYSLEYQVEDTWGRKSNVIDVTIDLKPAIQKNILEFDRLLGLENSNSISNLKKEKAFEIGFDHYNKKIKLNVVNSSGLLIWTTNDLYSIKIMDSNNAVKFEKQFSGNGANSTSDANPINDLQFEYGDKIKLTSNQGPAIRILGKVINPQEDYADGTDFGSILEDTTFTITKNGLEASFSEKQELSNDSIAYYAGINGKLSFNMEVDIKSKQFKFTEIDPNSKNQYYYNEYLDTHDKRNNDRFTITHHGDNGNVKRQITMKSRMKPDMLYNEFNNQSFEIGDYLTFKVSDTRNRNLNFRLYGSINDAKEDYTNGIEKDHLEEFNTARFYITANGLHAAYNKPPEIIAPDMVIQLGQDFNTAHGLIVKDDYDKNVTAQITGSVTPNKPGAYMLTYTATDSWGGKTVFDRFVIVQAPPEIEVVNETVIELNSMTDEEAKQHVEENLVTVTDFEDGDLLHKTDISIRYLNPNAKSTVSGDTFTTNREGTYEVTYAVTDNDDNTVTKVVKLEVVKTIGVTVPLNNNVPFQVVTNLIKKPNEEEPDPFISGMIKLKNNNLYNQIDVKVKSFTQKNKNSNSLQIVDPNQIDPDNMNSDESMTKMALGIYAKQGSVSRNTSKETPQWLTPGMGSSDVIATIPKAENTRHPGEATLSFTSKHGKKFKGGTSRGKFDLILEFK